MSKEYEDILNTKERELLMSQTHLKEKPNKNKNEESYADNYDFLNENNNDLMEDEDPGDDNIDFLGEIGNDSPLK